MMDVLGRINQANGRLKASKIGVFIQLRGERLYLRATLPPKPNAEKNLAFRQEISLGVYANSAGIAHAENEARLVGALLGKQQFSWEPYLKQTESNETRTLGEWIALFEEDYFTKRERNPKSETTWHKDYYAVLRRLPVDQLLCEKILNECVTQTAPDTKNRKRTCFVLDAFARFTKLDVSFAKLSGNYSPKKASSRDLPTDEVIVQWYNKIGNPSWRWVYALLATYGLRPHEAFNLDLSSLKEAPGILSIQDGKTGARRVFPLFPEWWEKWQLGEVVLPKVSGANNADLGHRVSVQFSRMGIPFKPYDLRHAWAVRAIHFGWDLSMASSQMGHSVSVHTDLYHRWISDDHYRKTFEVLLNRADRPKAP
jgi:integrase